MDVTSFNVVSAPKAEKKKTETASSVITLHTQQHVCHICHFVSLLDICLQAGILLDLFFENEDDGDIFLRNACQFSTDYMAL
jgi:hypothetical protein